MEKTYTLEVAGITRRLPIIPITEKLSIASFVILGDTELVTAVAPLLAAKLPQVDVVITAEAKGIPLIHEVSRVLKMKKYYVARKSTKLYMQKKQVLCLDGADASEIAGKRVAIIDDVISTGKSLQAIEDLVIQAGGIVVARAAILAEGEAAERSDIVFLQELPLFPHEIE